LTRAAIAARISRVNALAVDRQIEDGRAYFARKGVTVPADNVFVDDGISASAFTKKRRPEYLRLLAKIEADELDELWMWAEDRTHRQVLELAEFITLCREHGVKVATAGTEYDLSDPDQVTMWFIKVRFAEAEVEKTSKRLRRQRLQAATLGRRHAGGSREFGARGLRRVADPDGTWRTEPIVSEAQAARERALIAEAARRVLAGDSLRAIRLDWTAAGIRTATGKVFANQTLRKLLLSPRLAGYRTHLGVLHPSDDYPVVLDPGTWEAVGAVLRDPARITNHRGGLPRHLLSGLLYCGICGHRMSSRPRGDGFIYRCPPPDGSGNCGRVSRDAKRVERLITVALFKAVESRAWDEQAAELPADDPARPHHERVAELTAELDTLDGMLAEAVLAERQGRAPKPSAATLRRKLAEREAERDQHAEAAARLQRGRVVAAVPRNLRAVWPGLSLDRRRSILRAVLVLPPEGKGIVVSPQGSNLGPGGFDVDTISADWRA
jgi:DNA invertase Pin-like site-specific DNA recombinase